MAGWGGWDRLLFFMALAAYAAAACFAVGQLLNKRTTLPYQALRGAIFIGLAGNGAAIVIRAMESGHLPFANMYEFGIVLVFVTVVLADLLARRYMVPLHAFVLPVIVIMAYTILISYHASQSLMPALKSCWLIIHVIMAAAAYGSLTTACAVAAMYLYIKRLKEEENKEHPLPSLEQLDMLANLLVSYAMPCLTLLIITGAIWAEYAWGSYWRWDPKETWSLITWLIYAIYLHGRRVLGWRGEASMWLIIVGFIAVLITFMGVNLLRLGIHAYF